MTVPARAMLSLDLSDRSYPALRLAAFLHERWGTIVEVYYVWATAPELDTADEGRPDRELESLARVQTSWETLDYLGALERRGLVRISGYLTRERNGRSLVSLAAREGYALLLVGSRHEIGSPEGFKVHKDEASAPIHDLPLSPASGGKGRG